MGERDSKKLRVSTIWTQIDRLEKQKAAVEKKRLAYEEQLEARRLASNKKAERKASRIQARLDQCIDAANKGQRQPVDLPPDDELDSEETEE